MNVIDKMMAQLDADGNGKVDAKELMTVLKGMDIDMQSVTEFIKENDKDGDGSLNRDELYQFFKSIFG